MPLYNLDNIIVYHVMSKYMVLSMTVNLNIQTYHKRKQMVPAHDVINLLL